jgi:hypothetical protein
MLLAVAAFLQQGVLSVVSQAAAAAGFLPHPAETMVGSIHVHGEGTGPVHMHDGDNTAGHTHDHADHDDMDEPASTLFWALGSMPAVVSETAAAAIAFSAVSANQAFPSDRCDGIEPDGLSRPPSTPSIV